MKLTELIKKCSPLPWRIDENESVTFGESRLRDRVCLTGFAIAQGSNTDEASSNNTYVHHAANVLPELVSAARNYLNTASVSAAENLASLERLRKAIAAAEEVNTP